MLRDADGTVRQGGPSSPAAAPVLPGEEEGLLTPVWIGLASGVLALAIAQAEVFAPLREALWPGHAETPPRPRPSGARGRLAYLSTCPLCLGAWLSAGLLALQGPPPGLVWPVAWGASWAVSAAVAYGLDRLAGGDRGE